jgi:uncharacterized protein YukE
MTTYEEFAQTLREYRESLEKLAAALHASVERRRDFNRRMAERLGISLDDPNPADTKERG